MILWQVKSFQYVHLKLLLGKSAHFERQRKIKFKNELCIML